MSEEKDVFRDCLSRASLELSQHAADRIAAAVEEEDDLEAEMAQDSELAALVAMQLGLL